ncbi:MAG: S-formylglutathione hydrolase [Gammaproteobacteria bacterium]|nr:S-formylglutathione hydrolase [Gammaproteobacteria bacterium]
MQPPAGFTLLNRYRVFGGWQQFFSHSSTNTHCDMRFGLYLPPQAEAGRVPLLIYLAGLTCTEETFAIKAGAQRIAAELGLAVLTPDTSPRVRLPGDDESWDFGLAAGFYLDATEAPWSTHYRMYSYVASELPYALARSFPVDTARMGIFGHSMGGHGALTIGLKHPERFRTLSAFAPISAPMQCPWGQKALPRYLGENRDAWRRYDATELVATVRNAAQRAPLLVDQGLDDEFLAKQLMPEKLEAACRAVGYPLTLRQHAGYGHGYWFVSTFVEDHLRHHARGLSAAA